MLFFWEDDKMTEYKWGHVMRYLKFGWRRLGKKHYLKLISLHFQMRKVWSKVLRKWGERIIAIHRKRNYSSKYLQQIWQQYQWLYIFEYLIFAVILVSMKLYLKAKYFSAEAAINGKLWKLIYSHAFNTSNISELQGFINIIVYICNCYHI